MNQEILDRLGVITDEEREIMNGRTEIDRNRYTEGQELVIDSKKMLEHGKMISISLTPGSSISPGTSIITLK